MADFESWDNSPAKNEAPKPVRDLYRGESLNKIRRAEILARITVFILLGLAGSAIWAILHHWK